MQPAPALLDTQEVARIVRRSEGTLRNWRSEGLGPRFVTNPDTGRFLGYRLADVEAWLASGNGGPAE